MRCSSLTAWLAAGSSLLPGSHAIYININDQTNVTMAAVTAGTNMLTYYNGTKYGYAPGILTNPYYWWEAGAMFSVLIHFWHLTGNDTYNKITMDGLLWQRGDGNNFEPVNQTKDLGNDDQSFWAYAALDAAEFGFPNPPDGDPSWLSLAQAVFNRQIGRWDPLTCGGGIRWQIYQFNPGWTYKNTAANGGLFQIAARLARFTGNQTYADNANKIWNWLVGVNFLQLKNNGFYAVIDGSGTGGNCSGDDTDLIQWTYNHGTILMGAAYMYNYTNGSSLWYTRLTQLVEGASVFFVQPGGATDQAPGTSNGTILSEVACEFPTPQTCKVDQPAFKASLIRWLAVTTQLAPFTARMIYPWLNNTANHAASQCVGSIGDKDTNNPEPGGPLGTWCGRRMYSTVFDGYSGLGEQMSAMSAMQNVLIRNSTPPYTTVTGGNSTSDPEAGNTPTNPTILGYIYSEPVKRGDIAGAWILTALAMIIIGAGAIWMVREEPDGAWGGSGEGADWASPASGNSAYYKKTYGYGAYRLAGLQAGGVYAGKNSASRLRFARPKGPTIGQGSGGWWFGTGQGVGEKWWDKKGEEHAEELAEKMASAPYLPQQQPRDSVNSYDSRRGLFSRFTSSSAKNKNKPRDDLPGGKSEKPGEWKSIGKGVFVRARELDGADSSGTQSPAPGVKRPASVNTASAAARPQPSRRQSEITNAAQPANRRESRRESAAPSERPSVRQSRAPSIQGAASTKGGKTLHWPAAPPEDFSDEEDGYDPRHDA